MTPRFSVLVALYNKEQYVARCLDSILGQSFAGFEVLVVDDGSTDQGPEIARGYLKDPRVRLISQANAGPGAARNRAASEANGEWLAPLDADDAWDPSYLAESAKLLDGHLCRVACLTWAILEFPASFSTATRWAWAGISEGMHRAEPDSNPEVITAFLSNMLPSSTVIRKTAFDEAGGFYAKNRCLYAEDAYLWLKILLRHPVAFDTRPLAIRYLDASELSMNFAGVRPVEPFLVDPQDLYAACPEDLRELLREVLAIRAFKTASVYGYFGEEKTARDLVRQYLTPADWRLPYFFLALVGCTPAAKWLGAAARLAKVNLRATTHAQ